MEYSECLPTLLSPLAERTCFSQDWDARADLAGARDRRARRRGAGRVGGGAQKLQRCCRSRSSCCSVAAHAAVALAASSDHMTNEGSGELLGNHASGCARVPECVDFSHRIAFSLYRLYFLWEPYFNYLDRVMHSLWCYGKLDHFRRKWPIFPI